MGEIGLKFTALYMNNYSNFEQVEQLKIILQTIYKDMLTEGDLEWLTIYTENPKIHFEDYGYLSLNGFNGFSFNISSELVELVTEWDWLFFLKDLKTRKELRKMCLKIAKYLGNPIYVPDSYCYSSYVFEGKTYNDVVNSLKTQYGESVTDISDMLVQYEMYWDTTGYYIES